MADKLLNSNVLLIVRSNEYTQIYIYSDDSPKTMLNVFLPFNIVKCILCTHVKCVCIVAKGSYYSKLLFSLWKNIITLEQRLPDLKMEVLMTRLTHHLLGSAAARGE